MNDWEVLEDRIRLYISQELSNMIQHGSVFPSPIWSYHKEMARAAMVVMEAIAAVDEARVLASACDEDADAFYKHIGEELSDGDRGEIRGWGNPAADMIR